jgi:DNA-binding response OmpR family regulator
LPKENKLVTNQLALVIEDDDNLSAIFAEALKMAGYQTETIQDGAVASRRIKNTTPDLILLDLHLPHVSGEEILRQIRADDRLKQTNVVLATADHLLSDMLQDQVTFVLLKPISVSQLSTLAARLHPQN